MSNCMSNWIYGKRQLSFQNFKTNWNKYMIYQHEIVWLHGLIWQKKKSFVTQKDLSFPLHLIWREKKNIVAFDENKNNRKNIKGDFTQIFPPFKLWVFVSIILFYITFLALQQYISSKTYHSNVTTTSKNIMIRLRKFNSLMEYEIW